jgi:hypothetical protein
MKPHLGTARVAAMIFMGCLSGFYRNYDYKKWNELGTGAFVAHELQRFQTYMAHPKPLAFTLFSSIVGCALIFGLYELLAAAFCKFFPLQSAPIPTDVRPEVTRP